MHYEINGIAEIKETIWNKNKIWEIKINGENKIKTSGDHDILIIFKSGENQNENIKINGISRFRPKCKLSGRIDLFPKGTRYESSYTGEQLKLIAIQLHDDYLKDMRKNLQNLPILNIKDILINMLWERFEKSKNRIEKEAVVDSIIKIAVAKSKNNMLEATKSQTLSTEQKIKLEYFIEKNISQKILTKNIAEVLNEPTEKLKKLFKSTYYCSPQDLIKEFRIEKSEKLLAGTTIPISEVASRCGFSSNSRFSTVFKEKKGISPLRYRAIHLDKRALS
ncbi:TPA: helix-turn-helix transcriptional regulator [Pseudomonas aeruginosa]|nr:helix-turn-helix transcriptional regulator [Pseudomonas aeruginosa]HEP8853961.1 helix-turn-helix transcriptional regulator [Pseudomonas aeruginosa]